MTTRGKNLNDSSLNRIAYEEAAIAKIEARIAEGKGNKRSAGAIEKKRELIESIKTKMAARLERQAAKGVVVSTENDDDDTTVSNDVESMLAEADAAAVDVQVDQISDVEPVAV